MSDVKVKGAFREYYEKEAAYTKRYDSASFWDSRYHNKRKEAVMAVLKSHMHIGIFLDVGCGAGEYLFEMSNFCNETIGLDISAAYLKRIKKVNKKSSLIQAAAQTLPIKDKCVDYILCSETIEHLPNPDIAIREVSRVANSKFLISTPNYGLLRAIMTKISPYSVVELDRSVGHVNIFPIFKLNEKIIRTRCKIKLERTLHVIPPNIGERLDLSPKLSSLLDKLEIFLEKLFPKLGNISLVECEIFQNSM